MIALVTTYFLVFYILVPGILFRFASSLRVRLKLFQRTRTQEATFSVAVALLPFLFALAGTWYLPLMRHQPFPVAEGGDLQLRQDYRRVTTLLTSSDASRFLSSNSDPFLAREEYWQSLSRVLRRQMRFLCWYFVASALEGWIFGYLASKYGDWQINGQEESRNRKRSAFTRLSNLPAVVFNWAAGKLILPNISEWHMLLTDFNWPKREGFFISVDILQSNEHLYQGRVADYFIDTDGKLTGILLKNVSRFDRQAYVDARKFSIAPKTISREDFWKAIPSSHFYIGYASITNLNVRFAPKDQTLISLADKILQQETPDSYHIEVEADQEDNGIQLPHQPDLYS
jgi:hypothetical protein